MRNIPFNEVDNSLTRGLMKVKPICSKQLSKYILSMTPIVERAFKDLLPSHIGIFDGWSDSSIHYVAMFATFLSKQ